VSGDGVGEVHITYAALDGRARSIAALLQRVAGRGDRVLLLYPPGLEYVAAFLGCLYAAVVAVPVYPPNPRLERTLSRLLAIVRDADPTIVLTTSSILSIAEPLAAQDAAFARARWLATGAVHDAQAEQWHEPAIDRDTLAFLQYTSGSTTTPRGVMVSHGNLMHNEAVIQRVAALTADSVAVSWLPLYHDMGLIGCVLQPLYTGFPCTLMSPVDFLQKPFRWLQAITRTTVPVCDIAIG
jgi:acyl-CoA synthetase (AMP-forming)/AMP-acid ligase II